MLVIILLVEISTGVLSYLVYAQVSKSSFTEQLSEIAVKQYGEKDSVTAAVDKIHMKVRLQDNLQGFTGGPVH